MRTEDLPVIVLGAGGHAKVLIDSLRLAKRKIIGVVDNDSNKVGQYILDIPIIGTDDIVLTYNACDVLLVNGLGSVKSVRARTELFKRFKDKGYQFTNVIHPSAIIADYVHFSEGIQVMAGAIIQAGTNIGSNTIINTRSSIDHDCIIEDNVHIAPGVILSGGVKIGSGTHIGTGAVIIQGITIGANSLVAAGTVVVSGVCSNSIIMGVPGKVVNQ